jgi:hypothetical protein
MDDFTQSEADAHLLMVKFSDDELERASDQQQSSNLAILLTVVDLPRVGTGRREVAEQIRCIG